MKAAAVIVLVLCIAAVAGIGFLYLQSTVTVTWQDCIATDALTQTETFDNLKEAMSAGNLIGTPFVKDPPAGPEEYQFLTYTVHLQNRSFLPVEVVEIQVAPMKGDVLQMGETQAFDLDPRRSMTLSATILTLKSMHSVRELTVTYYIWGLPFSARITSGK